MFVLSEILEFCDLGYVGLGMNREWKEVELPEKYYVEFGNKAERWTKK
jgi:hypothetical protein